MYRKDRVDGMHGDVIIAINKINHPMCEIISRNSVDKISCKGQCDLLIVVCYRNSVSNNTTIFELFATIDTLTSKLSYDILPGRDFNFPGWEWSQMEHKPNAPYIQPHQDFLDRLSNCQLKQLMAELTGGDNTLDFILTNIPD